MSSLASRFFATADASIGAASGGTGGGIDMSQFTEDEISVNNIHFELQQLDQMSAGIESLRDVAEDTVAEGGLHPQAFTVLRAQAGHVMDIAGFNPIKANMQSYGDDVEDRMESSNVCMQSLKSAAKDIWDAIIKAIKDMMAKVKTWFAKMTNAVPGLVKKFEKLRNEAGKRTQGMKDDDEIKVSSTAVKLFGNGKALKLTRDEILKVSTGMTTVTKTLTEKLTMVAEMRKSAGKTTDGVKEADSEHLLGHLSGYASTIDTSIVDVNLNKELGFGEASEIDPLGIGNMAMVTKRSALPPTEDEVKMALNGTSKDKPVTDNQYTQITEVIDRIQKSSSFTFSIASMTANETDAEGIEIKAFNASDINTICTDMLAALAVITKFKEEQVKTDRQNDDFVKSLNKAIKSGENEKVEPENIKARGLLIKLAKSGANMFRGYASVAPTCAAFILRVANAEYDIANASLSAHK